MEPTLESLQAQILQLKRMIEELPASFGMQTSDALMSPNFSTGNSGWKIDEHGNVEFNDGNFRGDITGASGTFSGTLSAATITGSTITGGTITGTTISGGTITGGSIDIGGSDSTSFHVDSSGNVWWGSGGSYSGSSGKRISSSGIIDFSGGTITGGTIQTSSGTGSRIVMSGSGTSFSFYDSSNNVRAAFTGTGLTFYNSIGATSTIVNSDADGLTLTGGGGVVFIGAGGSQQLTVGTVYATADIAVDGGITLGGVYRTTWPTSGTTTLSGLTINTSKDWQGYGITNIGNIVPSSGGKNLGTTSGDGFGVYFRTYSSPPFSASSLNRGYMYYDTTVTDLCFSNGSDWYKVTATLR